MVNISTNYVLAENNFFKAGHGVSIGSETSGWVRNVAIRNSSLDGTDTAVRIKSCRGRGGAMQAAVYCSTQPHISLNSFNTYSLFLSFPVSLVNLASASSPPLFPFPHPTLQVAWRT